MGAFLRMEGISKAFPGVNALTNAELELDRGQVLGLLGENGAGKSTLMNVLGGIYTPDAGSISIDGAEVKVRGVIDAQAKGIAFIHQELALVPFLTVAENIYLGRELTGPLGGVSQKAMREGARAALDGLGLRIDPAAPIWTLSTGQQQMVEIAKALSLNAKIIVMDEPTSSLSEREVELLFQAVNRLKDRGIGLIYISHKMSEIFALTDRVTVMRDGGYIGTRVTAETNEAELIRMMVGRDLERYYTRDFNTPGDVALEVENFRVRANPPCSFDVRRGEIVGFYGLIGAGRSELMQSILKLDRGGSGVVRILGKEAPDLKPELMGRYRIAMVPEDRKGQGLFLDHSVAFNISITVLEKFISRIRLDRQAERKIVDKGIREMRVKTPRNDERVGNLSGGNQQKVVLAKWLATNPDVLILDEPTRGIDVGAKAEIYSIMNTLAQNGMAIIMISSDLPEIINMADRMVIMNDGRIAGQLAAHEFDEDTILKLALGGDTP